MKINEIFCTLAKAAGNLIISIKIPEISLHSLIDLALSQFTFIEDIQGVWQFANLINGRPEIVLPI